MGWFRTLTGIKEKPQLTVIEKACEDKGITIEVLIRKSGVSKGIVDKYNVMDAQIPQGTRRKLEKVLGVGALYGAAK